MIDVNIKGVLYGIAAALPIFRKLVLGISSTPLLPLD
jgi:NADP-dependent 3-hydroxy acid dehydrogenase YdfG